MKIYLVALLLLPCLTGCLSIMQPVSRDSVVGRWQHEMTGLLSSVETLSLQEDGIFSYHSDDTIVGLEMKGSWKLKDDRIWLYSDEVRVRGKTQPLEKYGWQGLPSQPLRLQDGKIILQLEEDKPFRKIR